MPKLFVAAELPATTTAELARIQPSPAAGLRLTAPAQMHITLHFLGDADAERMAAALSLIAVPAFTLRIDGVGHFLSADGTATLWAGVRESAELLGLHGAIADGLAGEGFRPEARRYTPHVSLARCNPEDPSSVVNEFLRRHKGLSIPAVPIAAFGLFASTFVSDAPVYRCERSFRLEAADGQRRGR